MYKHGIGREMNIQRRVVFFFKAEDGIRDLVRSRGLGDVYKRQRQALVHDGGHAGDQGPVDDVAVADNPADVAGAEVGLAGLAEVDVLHARSQGCLLYTSPSPRDRTRSRMPSSA